MQGGSKRYADPNLRASAAGRDSRRRPRHRESRGPGRQGPASRRGGSRAVPRRGVGTRPPASGSCGRGCASRGAEPPRRPSPPDRASTAGEAEARLSATTARTRRDPRRRGVASARRERRRPLAARSCRRGRYRRSDRARSAEPPPCERLVDEDGLVAPGGRKQAAGDERHAEDAEVAGPPGGLGRTLGVDRFVLPTHARGVACIPERWRASERGVHRPACCHAAASARGAPT